MAGWHHRCNECELVQTLGDGQGEGGPVCYRPRGCKESDMTERLDNNKDSMVMHETNVLSIGLYINTTVLSISPYNETTVLSICLYTDTTVLYIPWGQDEYVANSEVEGGGEQSKAYWILKVTGGL